MTDDQTTDDALPIEETITQTIEERLSALDRCGEQTVSFLAQALESTARQEYGDLLRRAEVAALQTSALAAVEQAAALHRIATALEAEHHVESVTHVTVNNLQGEEAAAAAAQPPVVTEQEPDEQPAQIHPDPEQTAVDEPADVAARAGAEERLAAEHEAAVQAEIDATTPSDAATPDVPKKRAPRKPSA